MLGQQLLGWPLGTSVGWTDIQEGVYRGDECLAGLLMGASMGTLGEALALEDPREASSLISDHVDRWGPFASVHLKELGNGGMPQGLPMPLD